ncbi:DALR domain-containing protein [Streptomyces sp. NRRL S-31]|uniref:DALR domain-containing protein n=1 Tax=Streptomyces sp. NRRL S-31 TaxID=1463898 RepID=UPI000699E842|nr:DALR domain-containing protein [Streptomyces sp. NRRL S-31]
MGRALEKFDPKGEETSIFSCGPLVFSHPHLGMLRGALGFDVLRRTLRWKGFPSRHVFMITDVDKGRADFRPTVPDELASASTPPSLGDIGSFYTQVFQDDLATLNFLPADHYARSSQYIPDMIDYARVLAAKGYAYPTETGLYFDTARAAGYGVLGNLNVSAQREGISSERPAGLRNSTDFALWRIADPAHSRMGWDSPWGWGLPGAHLGCSAISATLLGDHVDIHTGGKHHRQLHHVNEIAQSESYLGDGEPWVGYWLHHDMLTFGALPMVRGSAPTLGDITGSGVHPMACRLFLLGGHYRSPQAVTADAFQAAQTTLRRLVARLDPDDLPPHGVDTYEEALARIPAADTAAVRLLDRFDAAVCDDLNSPKALAALHEAVRSADVTPQGRRVLLAAADSVLGLRLRSLSPADLTPPKPMVPAVAHA